jgi:ABC-type lipoprotein release transport system permease subunit
MKELFVILLTALSAVCVSGVIIAIIGLLIGWILALLWNWIMPDLFGLPEASALQMFGLFLLIQLLFNSCSGAKINKNND